MNTEPIFYISQRGEQAGPFTREELRTHSIRRNTLVWNEEQWAWTPASAVGGLDGLFDGHARTIGDQYRSLLSSLGHLYHKALRTVHAAERGQMAR